MLSFRKVALIQMEDLQFILILSRNIQIMRRLHLSESSTAQEDIAMHFYQVQIVLMQIIVCQGIKTSPWRLWKIRCRSFDEMASSSKKGTVSHRS